MHVQIQFMRNKADIAKEFNFHRNTITKWFSRPGAPQPGPKGYDPEEVGRFINECSASEKSMAKASPRMRELKENEVHERVRKLKLANDAKEKLLIPMAERDAEIREMAAEIQRVLYQIPDRAPELSGLSTADVSNRVRKMIDEAVRTLKATAEVIAPDYCTLCRRRKDECPPEN